MGITVPSARLPVTGIVISVVFETLLNAPLAKLYVPSTAAFVSVTDMLLSVTPLSAVATTNTLASLCSKPSFRSVFKPLQLVASSDWMR